MSLKWLMVFVFAPICLIWGGFAIGYYQGQQSVKPEIIEKYYHTTDNITTKEVQAIYIDKPVPIEKPVVVYIDKPFYVPSPSNRHFTSLAELYQWLKEDKTDELKYTGVNPLALDCDNFAYILQANADRAGFLLSTQYEYEHLYNTALIDNTIYGIEPQTDKIWKLVEVD